MNARKRKYPDLSALLLFCTILLILFLFRQIFAEQKKEEIAVQLTASLPSGEITNELYQKIQDFPGLMHCRAVYSAQAEIKIGSFQTSAEILGVDLSAWPMKITKSAGAKRQGTAPLIVAGEDFFQTLTDEYGVSITKRQIRIFQEKIDTTVPEITFVSNVSGSPFSGGKASAPVGTDTGSSQDINTFSGSKAPSSVTGSFLALAEGDKLYMDAAQMKELLKACQLSAGLSRVCLEIKGEQNAQNAKQSLTKAGFVVED